MCGMAVRSYGWLWFGPVIGIGAVFISASYRFILGGITMVPCCLATLIAGVVSGWVWYFYREKITTVIAAIIAIILACVPTLLVCFLTPDNMGWITIAETPADAGTIILIPLSVVVFSLCYRGAKRYASKETQ